MSNTQVFSKTYAAQKLFFVWFCILTVFATYNFYHNWKDSTFQSQQYEYLQADKIERANALAEHKYLRDRIMYLEDLLKKAGIDVSGGPQLPIPSPTINRPEITDR